MNICDLVTNFALDKRAQKIRDVAQLGGLVGLMNSVEAAYLDYDEETIARCFWLLFGVFYMISATGDDNFNSDRHFHSNRKFKAEGLEEVRKVEITYDEYMEIKRTTTAYFASRT